MLVQPGLVQCLAVGVRIGAVEHDGLPLEAALFEQLAQIGLRADGFREDHGLALASLGDDLVEDIRQAVQQRLAFGVVRDRRGQIAVLGEPLDFRFELSCIDALCIVGVVLNRVGFRTGIRFAPVLGFVAETINII